MPNERSRTQRQYFVKFHLYETSRKWISIRTERGELAAWGWSWSGNLTRKEREGSFHSDGNVLKLDWGDGCTTLQIY